MTQSCVVHHGLRHRLMANIGTIREYPKKFTNKISASRGFREKKMKCLSVLLLGLTLFVYGGGEKVADAMASESAGEEIIETMDDIDDRIDDAID